MKNKHFNTSPVKRLKVLAFIFLFTITSAFSQNLKVAVAANLQAVIKVLQKDFKKQTGIEIEPIVGSSGNLTTQIRNGAPFDVFLSADMSFPETLFKEGFSVKKPTIYAYGSLIVCSNQINRLENWDKVLLSDKVKKIAIANPAIAPYGKAAEDALRFKGILSNVQSKIVTGESISQVNTYITTGVAEIGFTTLALVKDPANKTTLYWKAVDPKIYAQIQQGVVILKHAAENQAAEKFLKYIFSSEAGDIFEEYGYIVAHE